MKPPFESRGAGQLPWFALRVRTCSERTVAERLSDRGIAVFVPRDLAGRAAFPGYLFARFYAREKASVLVKGVHSVLSIAGEPAAIPDAEIDSLRQVLETVVVIQPSILAIGERVRVIRGPLTGVIGELLATESGGTLQIGITLLRRALRVAIDPKDVVPVSEKSDETPIL